MELKIYDRIRQRKVEFFNDFSLNLKYDSVGSTFGISFFFDPNNSEHKELMCIGHYHECTLEHNGEVLLTGQILTQSFHDNPVKEMVTLSGYSLAGVIEDCEIPTTLYPLQSSGLSLKQIAENLLKPFKLKLVVDSEVSAKANEVYPEITAKESQTIKAYLAELATQKGIVISHNEKGELLFTKAKTESESILDFDLSNGVMPSVSMKLDFSGQQIHSHITVMQQADDDGGNAGEYTIRNPFVINTVYRPKVIKQSSGTDMNSEDAAKMALANELKNLKLVIELDRWDINERIIKPNNIITVRNPNIYLYKKSKWFIESVSYKGNQERTTATLTCVLPEVYSLKMPEYLFKGINLH